MSIASKQKRIGMNAIMGSRYINPKLLRVDLGLSCRVLGLRVGCAGTTISGWESRRRTPNVVDIWKLAGALGIVQQNMGKLCAYWALVDD